MALAPPCAPVFKERVLFFDAVFPVALGDPPTLSHMPLPYDAVL